MFHILYQNVRGLRTNTQKFVLSVFDNEGDIVLLTETWLSNDILSSELFDDCYNDLLITIKCIFDCQDMKSISRVPQIDLLGVKILNNVDIIALYITLSITLANYIVLFDILRAH